MADTPARSVGVVADALHTPGVTSAAEARLDDAGLIAVQGPTALDARTGVLRGPGTTTLVTGTADTAPMAYLIGPHHWVTNRGVATDGVYRGTLEASQRVTTTAAPASGSRIDVIYAKQGDANSTISPDGTTAPIYGVVQGNSTTGTPTAPALPVGAIEVGRATVSAGALSTNDSHVTITTKPRLTVARGARVPVWDQTDRDSLTAFKGLEVYRLDTGQVQLCTGTGPTTWATTYDPNLAKAPTLYGIELLRTTASGGSISVPNNAITAVTFAAAVKDVGGFYTAAGATVPAGLAGLYSISLHGKLDAGVNSRFFTECLVNGTTEVRANGYGDGEVSAARNVRLAAGDQLSAQTFQNSGAARSLVKVALTAHLIGL